MLPLYMQIDQEERAGKSALCPVGSPSDHVLGLADHTPRSPLSALQLTTVTACRYTTADLPPLSDKDPLQCKSDQRATPYTDRRSG